jgi:2-oxoglutarate ferredoxin oxidoreductase subunit gamma
VGEVAQRVGYIRAANIVALAAFVARSKIVDVEILRSCVRSEFSKKPKLIDVNMAAIDAGVAEAAAA